MWAKSKPGDYISFRTFIFGITSQSMFPHGVVYEGVSEEPMSFRGESGANDSMVRPNPQPMFNDIHIYMLYCTVLTQWETYRSRSATTSSRSPCPTRR